MVDRRQQPDRRSQPRGGRRQLADKFECTVCGCLRSFVIPRQPTREQQRSGGVWRVRKCKTCGAELHTEEVLRRVVPKNSPPPTTSSDQPR